MSLALGRELHFADAPRDLLVDLHGRRGLEWRVPGEKLEGEDAQGPPINGMRVPFGCDELWSKVVRGATRRVCLADNHLGKAHVCKLHTALLVEQEVLRLQVSEDDLLRVQVFEGKGRTGHVELRMLLLAPQALSVVGGIKLAAQRQLQEQVEVLLTIVGLKELDNEVGIALQLDILLAHDALLHARLHDVALAQALQCVGLLILDVLNQVHSAEAAAAQQPENLQVLAEDETKLLLRHTGGNLLHNLRSCFPPGVQRLQGTDKHVEGGPVDDQSRGRLRRDLDSGLSRLVV
mmetsp:Transcript_90658/g.293460  ORF Transcript_90658/g.293460 Transcript_90658/m.293460 type:complete len:292 (-) Transcript_90658:1196-2071(-)